jgi:hypothetical protein
VQRARAERDEGNNINHAEAGVHALVGSQIQEVDGLSREALHVGTQLVGVVDQGKDAAVVKRVTVSVGE